MKFNKQLFLSYRSWSQNSYSVQRQQVSKFRAVEITQIFVILCLVILFLHAGIASAATDAKPEVEVSEAAGIGRNEKDVPVPQRKPDVSIQDRLTKIFKITGWFEDLNVKSEEGVVTIAGTVTEISQRDWAMNLAKDTEGVVAVVNQVKLKEVGWLDFNSTEKEIRTISKGFFATLPHLLIAAIILAISIVLFRFLSGVSRRFWSRRLTNPILSEVMGKVGALPVIFLGLYFVLRVLDLTGLAFSLLGGTGALGLVAGFAFKNILENYFSGVILSVRKPFIIGDVIQVGPEKGVVFRMTTRGITLLDFDGSQILIPNSTVFTSIIHNKTVNPLARIRMEFDLDEAKPAEEQRQVLISYLRERSEIVKDPATETLVIKTGSKSKLEARFWINIRETSEDKLKAVIAAGFKARESNQPVAADGGIEISTKSEVKALLARASQTPPADPTEKNTVHERREGAHL